MRFVDQFDVILFDLNGTFMFGHDRFGAEQDYHRTYQACGGRRLDRATLTRTMNQCLDGLLRVYDDPSRFDDFPTLREAFTEYAGAPPEEHAALCDTFALHELGEVPPAQASVLRQLSATHRLGVVSNICGDPARWRAHFAGVGLGSAFACTVFSSEGRSIKPSRQLFQRAISALSHPARVLFVGDSFERDMVPARALGWGTVWISETKGGDADRVIPSVVELPSLRA